MTLFICKKGEGFEVVLLQSFLSSQKIYSTIYICAEHLMIKFLPCIGGEQADFFGEATAGPAGN